MGKTSDIVDDLEQSLHSKLSEYIQVRSREYIEKGLRGRLVLEFSNGALNQVYDQAIINGLTMTGFYLDKLTSE